MVRYGDPDKAEEWAFLKKYSAYHNLDPAKAKDYPPLLMTTSTRDDRVHPYHARSFVKRLQDLGAPQVLYYENVEGGPRGRGRRQAAGLHGHPVPRLPRPDRRQGGAAKEVSEREHVFTRGLVPSGGGGGHRWEHGLVAGSGGYALCALIAMGECANIMRRSSTLMWGSRQPTNRPALRPVLAPCCLLLTTHYALISSRASCMRSNATSFQLRVSRASPISTSQLGARSEDGIGNDKV